MDTKLLSKEVIKGFIMREFNNDPRITDELLFDGKRMTMECYVLLKDIMPRKGYYDGNILDDLGYHCYLSFDVPSDNGNKYDKTKKSIMAPTIEKVCKHLDKLVGKNGCYMISDAIYGEREKGDEYGGTKHRYSSGIDNIYVDIWVFSREASMLEFAENNDLKKKLLLELD